jgi:hypothetical protein
LSGERQGDAIGQLKSQHRAFTISLQPARQALPQLPFSPRRFTSMFRRLIF